MNDFWTLTHGMDCIKYEKFSEIADAIQRYYSFSSPVFWMWKAFQFGFVYGKHEERARRKKKVS